MTLHRVAVPFLALGALLLVAGAPTAAAAASAPTAAVDTAATSSSTVDYDENDAVIANPERGFDHTLETHYLADGSGYDPLDGDTLRGYRDDGVTQVVRVFYLEKFVDQPTLDPAWLALVQADFDTARSAGVSLIPRFAYKQGGDYPYTAPYGDADLPIVLGHIRQLAPLLQRDQDVIAAVQMGFIGLWGEGYYSDYFSEPDDSVSDADWQKRREVVQALLAALPGDRMIQVRTMLMKQTIENVPTGEGGALTPAQAYDGSDLARIGHHNDCFLASDDDFGTFLSDPITLDQQYLAADSRYVPVGGETCAVNSPRSDYPSASAEMARYHYSYLNADYNTDVLDTWGAAGVTDAAKRLGYRFVMTQSRVTGSAVQLDVRNDGWAAPYNPRPAALVLTGGDGVAHTLSFGSDARTWAPGTSTTLSADACGLPAGDYAASLALPSATASVAADPDYAIQTANTRTWDAASGTNALGQTVTVSGAGCAAAVSDAAAVASDPQLARTGSAVSPALPLGGALAIGVGVLLLVVRRRRAQA